MLHTLNIGGQNRPILFGNSVYRKLKNDLGITSLEVCLAVSKADFTHTPDVIYYALRCGEEFTNSQPGQYTADQVSLWLDADPAALKLAMSWFADAIYTSTGNEAPKEEPDTPDESKKKNLTTTIGNP